MINLSRRQFSSAALLTGVSMALWGRGTQAATPGEDLAEPIETSQLLVSVAVEGVPSLFLIDTGSSFSVITPAAVAALGLIATGEQAIPDLGPTLAAPLYEATLASGADPFRLQLGAVEDLTLVTELAGSAEGELDGVLGADFLSRFTDVSLTGTSFTGVLTNVPAPMMRGAALAQPLSSPFTVTYPVFKIGSEYVVVIDIIDGSKKKVTRAFLLDTGASVSLLTTQQALELGLLPLQIGPAPFVPAVVPIVGIGGTVSVPVTPVGLPGLGSFPFVIGNLRLPPAAVGLIGVDVLGGSFTLQINGGQGTLTITPPLGQFVELLISIFTTLLRPLRRIVGLPLAQ